MKTVIIIPTYNEKENIGRVLDELEIIFNKCPREFSMHILVVDDTSPDGTGEIVKQKGKQYSNIHLLVNAKKEGLGAAYVKGMNYAINKLEADLVFEFDADGSHQPKYLPGMLETINKGADVVVGSRYVSGGSMPKDWGLNRKIISYLGNLIARTVLFTFKYHDMTSGFRVSKTEFLRKIDLDKLLSKQYAYKIHLFFALHKMGAKIVEYPIDFIDRSKGKSKFPKNNIKDSLGVVFTLRYKENERFIKVCLVGGVGLIIQLTIFNILRLLIANPFKTINLQMLNIKFPLIIPVHTLIAVEIAIVSNFLINNYWTFVKDRANSLLELIVKFIPFNLTSTGSIVIQWVVLVIGVKFLGSNFIVDNVLTITGILIGLIWNYTMYTKIIWKKKN